MDKKETKPADMEDKKLADKEEIKLANVEELVDAEALMDAKDLLVIYYIYQY